MSWFCDFTNMVIWKQTVFAAEFQYMVCMHKRGNIDFETIFANFQKSDHMDPLIYQLQHVAVYTREALEREYPIIYAESVLTGVTKETKEAQLKKDL